MGRFDSGNGLCQLVFCNEDVYYTEGMIRLNIRQYLYFELKKLNYDGIYFLSGDEEGCELSVPDAAAMTLYGRYEKKSFLGRLFAKTENTVGTQKFSIENPKEFWARAIQMMWNEKQLAFVCSIGAFSMLKYYPEYVEALCELSDRNYMRGHLLLVQAPVVAEGSLPYFADIKGIFRSRLFPELQQIFALGKNVYIYDRMHQEMGDKAVFLNYLDYPDTVRLVRHFFFKYPGYIENEGWSLADFADYIWMYYHSQKFMAHEKDILPENEKRLFFVIEKSLEDQVRLRRIQAAIVHIRQMDTRSLPLWQILEEKYGIDRWERLIYEDSAVLRRLLQMPVMRLLKEYQNYTATYMSEAFFKIKERLKRPSLMFHEMQVNTFMNRCADALQAACGRRDMLTAEKAVRALDYITMWRASESVYGGMPQQMQAEILTQQCNYYLKVIYAAEKLYAITKIYKQSESEIQDNKKRMKSCMDDVNNFIRMKPWIEDEERRQKGRQTAVSAEVLMFTQMRREVIALDRSIKEATYMQAQKHAMMTQCQDNIQKMEMAINSIAMGDAYQLRENMMQAAETVKKAYLENDSLIREMSEESDADQSLTIEAAMKQYENIMSDMDVEEEFHKIVHDFDMAEKEKVVQMND